MKKKVTSMTQGTQSSQFNLALSRLTERTKNFKSEADKSSIYELASTKRQQHSPQKSVLEVLVKKKRVLSPNRQHCKQAQIPKINSNKFKAHLKTRMSTNSESLKIIYGVTTYKGFKKYTNPHQIGIHLGKIKHILLCEAYDGLQASEMIKEIYPIQLKKYSTKEIQQKPEKYILQAFKETQLKIINKLKGIRNNSGSSLASIIFGPQLIAVGNCGASHVICSTKRGEILNLADQHTTRNQAQLQRIFDNKGKIYQTVIQVQNQKQLAVYGPYRLTPSGLIYTRTLGKAIEYQNKSNTNNNQILISTPQVKYINQKQVKWICVLSESVGKYCPIDNIQKYIEEQLDKNCQQCGLNQISQRCSTKIIEHIIRLGINDAFSAIVVIMDKKKQASTQLDPQISALDFAFLQNSPRFGGSDKQSNNKYSKNPKHRGNNKTTYSQLSRQKNRYRNCIK